MKKFTIVSCIACLLIFVGMISFVLLSDDFKEPVAADTNVAEDDQSSPVWSMTMDDLVSYLAEKGLIDTSSPSLLSTSGFCSNAMKYSGAEIYYWDLNSLSSKTDEYKAYESLKTEGYIDLFNTGNIISPKRNGPFALLTTRYEGDVKELEDAFMQFGQE